MGAFLSVGPAGNDRYHAAAGKPVHQMRILIVEDELIIALDIESMLIEFGHEVCGLATTSDEAIRMAYAKAARPDRF